MAISKSDLEFKFAAPLRRQLQAFWSWWTGEIEAVLPQGLRRLILPRIPKVYLDLDGPPVLSTPPDGAIVCDGRPLFQWTLLPAATSYQIQVDDDVGFFSPAIDATTVDADYMPDPLLPAGAYFWRVKSQGPCGDSDWSARWQLTIVDTISAPILSSPPDASITCAADMAKAGCEVIVYEAFHEPGSNVPSANEMLDPQAPTTNDAALEKTVDR